VNALDVEISLKLSRKIALYFNSDRSTKITEEEYYEAELFVSFH